MDGAPQTGIGDGVTPARALAFIRRLGTRGFDLDSKTLLRLHRLLFLLVERGEWPDDPGQLRCLMAPAICTSADQQAEFYLLFEEFAKHPEAAEAIEDEPGLADGQSKTADTQPARTAQSRPTYVWKRWFVIGPFVVALVSLALILSIEIPKLTKTSSSVSLPPSAVISQPPPGTVALAPTAVKGPVSIQGKIVDQQSGKELPGSLVRYLGNTAHDTGTPGDLVLLAPQDDSFWVLATRDGYQPALKLREQGALDPFTIAMTADPPSPRTPPVTKVPLTGWRGWAWGHRAWLQALSAATPALAMAGWWVLLYYRRSRLRKFLLPLNLSTYKLRTKSAADKLLRSQAMKNSAREFRLRRPRLSNDLDQTATVDSSIRNGTWFTPVPARARLEPEYLVLIERIGPRDQQARFYDELMKRLESRDVTVDRYFFAGDPRQCTRDGKRFSISELAALHPHHNLWIVTDSDRFLNRVTGEPAEWVAHLGQWTDRAVLTPTAHNPYADWLLRQQDFRLVTADPAGLARLPGTMAPTKEGSFVPGWDAFPRMLRGDSARWVSEVEPSAADKSELFTQVRRFLGMAAYDCLSACAIYPAMSWNLIVELVASVAEGEPPEPILARLVGLPWFRRGKMPEWVRTRLTQRLPEVAERKAYPAIERFIDNSVALGGKTDDWLEFGRLTAHDHALLFLQRGVRPKRIAQDYVFLSFLWRQRVGPIAPGSPSWLRRKLFRGGYAMFGAQPLAHALLAAAALLVGAGGWWAASAATSLWKPIVVSRPELAYPSGFHGAMLDIARAMAGDSTGVPDTGFVNWCELRAAELLGRKPEFKADPQFKDGNGVRPGDQVDERDEKSMDWSPALVSGVDESGLQVLRQRNGSVGWQDDPAYFDLPYSGYFGSSFSRTLDPPAGSPVSPKDYLPTVVDWASQMSPVRTSAANADATSIAMAEVEEFLIRKQLHQTLLLSPSYINYETRLQQGPVKNGSDIALEYAAMGLMGKGSVTQSAWQFASTPPPTVEDGPHYRIQRFRKLTDLDALRMALAAGPVVASFDVSSSVSAGSNLANAPAISGTQVSAGDRGTRSQPVASASLQVTGAPPVAVVGYDDQKKQLKVMGSSGTRRGDHGYGYMAYGDITRINGIALSGVAMASIGLPESLPIPAGTGSSGGQAPVGQCVGPEIVALDNMNTDLVQNGGTPPGFQTANPTGTRPLYCLVSITTYHWNDGKGTPPGKIGLADSTGKFVVGARQAVGSPGQGGAPNVNWTATFSSPLMLLRGSYVVTDSAPATWSQNSGSGGKGFARVVVRQFCAPGQGGSCGAQGAAGRTSGVDASEGSVASSNDPASQLRALRWTVEVNGTHWNLSFPFQTLGPPPKASNEILQSIPPTELYIYGISDLSALGRLTKLTWLTVTQSPVSDISALGSLKNLKSLSLTHTQVTDVSGLSGLTNLTSLQIEGSNVSNVSALASLKNLTVLGIALNQISDISALGSLKNLKSLSLAGAKVSDFSILNSLRSLTTLNLIGTPIANITVLENLRNLGDLRLGSTKIADVSPLRNLTSLYYLDLSRTQISDISPLAGLKKLGSLQLSGSSVNDLSALRNLTSLGDLDLSLTKVTDVSALAGLNNLTWLDLTGTKVANTQALKGLTRLKITGP